MSAAAAARIIPAIFSRPRQLNNYLVIIFLKSGTAIIKVAAPNDIKTINSDQISESPPPKIITFLKASMVYVKGRR